jgi:hypothetical protein
MRIWWIFEDGQTKGPYDAPDFEAGVKSGRVTPTTLVWTDGLPDWTPFAALKEQAPAARPTPLPSPQKQAPARAARPAETDTAAGLSSGRPRVSSKVFGAVGALVGVGLLLGATAFYLTPLPADIGPSIAGYELPLAAETAASPAGQLWTNPVTRKQVELPPGWRTSTGRNEAGEPLFVFTQADSSMQVIFASEEVSPGTPVTNYVQSLTKALTGTVRFEGPRTAAKVADKVIIEQQGRMASDDTSVHLSVAPGGDKVWRALAVSPTAPADNTGDFQVLRERLFASF